MSDIAEIIERRLADGRHIGDADCAKAAQRVRELEAERDSAIKERDDMAANAASWLDRADEAHGKLEVVEAERDEAAQRIRELEADLSEAMQACDSLRDRTLERTVRAQAAVALLGKVGEVLEPFSAAYGRGDGWPKEAQSVTRSYATCPTVRSWHFRKAATLHAEIIASQSQPTTDKGSPNDS